MGPDSFIDPNNQTATYAVGLGALSAGSTGLLDKLVLVAQVNGNVATNSAGGNKIIRAGKVRRLVANGNIVGEVYGRDNNVGGTATTTNRDWGVGRVEAASIAAGARVATESSASIGVINVGSIAGTVSASSSSGGAIYTIDVAGDINMSGFPNLIIAGALIDNIEANSITGTISAGSTGGKIRRVKTRSGNFTGAIRCDQIPSTGANPGIHVTGTFSGVITSVNLTPADCYFNAPITAAHMASGAIITSRGTIYSPITATSGRLGAIRAEKGFGAPGAPVTITAATGIDEVSVPGPDSAYANITCTTGGIGTFSMPYVFNGNVTADSFQTFDVGYWMGGTLTVRNSVPSTGVYQLDALSGTGQLRFTNGFAGLMRISESFASTASMVFGNHNLSGQVVLNAQNHPNGSWAGTVYTNTTTALTAPPYYTNTSASLGGGSIGLSPYHGHDNDGRPEQDPAEVDWLVNPPTPTQTWNGAPVVPQIVKANWWSNAHEIRIRFYGPLLSGVSPGTTVDPRSLGLTVWHCPSANAWDIATQVDVSDDFEAVLPPGTFNRDVQIRPKCGETYLRGSVPDMGGMYRVKRNISGGDPIYSNKLKCKYAYGSFNGSYQGPGSEPEVADFVHYFRFFCSPVDYAQTGGSPGPDGVLDNNDHVAFIDYGS